MRAKPCGNDEDGSSYEVNAIDSLTILADTWPTSGANPWSCDEPDVEWTRALRYRLNSDLPTYVVVVLVLGPGRRPVPGDAIGTRWERRQRGAEVLNRAADLAWR